MASTDLAQTPAATIHHLYDADIQIGALDQILGHPDTWPEHWHTALTNGGQEALLKTACADWAPAA